MANTSTYLIYGIVVKTWSLHIAALAHPHLVDPVLALDLIMMRFRTGTLQREEGKKILPLELWEMIKVELYEIEVVEAEKQELVRYGLYPRVEVRNGNEGRNVDKSPTPHAHRDYDNLAYLRTKRHLWEDLRNDRHPEIMSDFSDKVGLHSLSLAALAHFPANSGPIEYDRLLSFVSIRSNFDSLIPSSTITTRSVSDFSSDGYTGRSESAAFISPDVFTKTFNQTLRFKQLVKYYRLDLSDLDLPTFNHNRADHGNQVSEGNEGGKKGEEINKEVKKVLRVEPKWMLWSSSYDV